MTIVKKIKIKNYDRLRCTKCGRLMVKSSSENGLKDLVITKWGKKIIICPYCKAEHINPYGY